MINVYYHSDHDGIASAYQLYTKVLRNYYGRVTYEAIQYGDWPESLYNAEFSVFLDFCPSTALLESLPQRAKVTIYDHHANNVDMVKHILEKFRDCVVVFEPDSKGGCLMSPLVTDPLNEYVKLIGHRDVWDFSLPFTKEIHAALVAKDMDVKDYATWFKFFDNNPVLQDADIANGTRLVAEADALIAEAVRESVLVKLDGTFVMVSEAKGNSVSELGHALAEASPGGVGLVWTSRANGQFGLSFRSVEDCEVNAYHFAKMFKGSGHNHSAGAQADLVTLDKILNGSYANSGIPV